MRRIVIALAASAVLAACGDDNNDNNQQQALDCNNYCTQMNATCTGSDSQYAAALLIRDCATYCGNVTWPVGTAGAQSGNNLACRITHVGLAAAAATPAEKTLHCGHAGPTGAGTCGTLCENYCYLALKNCTGANGAGLGFTDNATCLAACAAFPQNGAINAGGNTVQCRIYHAGAAGTVGPAPHCGHAQVISSSAVGGTTPNGPCN